VTKLERMGKIKILITIGFMLSLGLMLSFADSPHQTVAAQSGQLPSGLTSLTNIPTPEPDNLSDFVRDRNAAIALGKALFWDMQVGSGGIQSCASCHFHAGADSRAVNQLNPGQRGGDNTFQTGPPNYTLTAADYPFHRLSDPNNRSSNVLFDSNDITSSQGVFNTNFVDITPGVAEDQVTHVADPVFNVNNINVRRVEARNTPTVVNAVFNFRNFWDGRAQEDFNGVNIWGARDADARVMQATDAANPSLVQVSLNKSSLASQAVGPPTNDFEMSARGRLFPKVGRKMLSLVPLAKQQVATDDSVLGYLANPNGMGLNTTYRDLIQQAFQPKWWQNTTHRVHCDAQGRNCQPPTPSANPDDFTQEEFNFSLFWGLAIQMYEATLRADDTPFDRYANGDSAALTVQQKDGLDIFVGQGKCINCHGGAEFTNASVRNVANKKIERMLMGDGGIAVYDNGFYNIGVRPTQEDIGVGGTEDSPPLPGRSLSFARFFQQTGQTPFVEGDDPAPDGPLDPNERVAVDGAFKTPGLRNVELTAPFFHNGGQLTLRQVVDFYNRGGDFHQQNINNLDPDIENLGLSEEQKEALVSFLLALTDERVRFHRAPFDHPSLQIPNGHPNPIVSDGVLYQPGNVQKAEDMFVEIPAVGQNGLASPLPNFPVHNASPPAGSMNMTLTATATFGSQVIATWNASSGAVHHYELERRHSINKPFTLLLPYTTSPSFINTGLQYGTAYLYRVRAVNAAGNTIGYSNVDLATVIYFTDDPLILNATPIKAQHFTELRQAVTAVRATAGLTAYTWTDATLAGALIKAVHLQEPRTNLDQALNLLGLPVQPYTDNSLAGVPIKKVHIEELRTRVR
jgi:cytochrome c peroxidase